MLAACSGPAATTAIAPPATGTKPAASQPVATAAKNSPTPSESRVIQVIESPRAASAPVSSPPIAPVASIAPSEPPPPVATPGLSPPLPLPPAPVTDPAQANRPTTIAVLLPLSGPQAGLGTSLFNAMQMALFDMADENLVLVPFDSKGNADGAQAAAQSALAQHPDVILGPLFATETRAVTALARPAGVRVLALTTDSTAVGDGTFALGFLPGPQAIQVIRHAQSQGYSRIAVLAPNNDYGRKVVDSLSAEPTVAPALAAIQFYDPTLPDAIGAVRSVMRTDPRRPGDPGFDALFLPADGNHARLIAAALPQAGVNKGQVRLLGTMLWDDGRTPQDPQLGGSWFATTAAAGHAEFEARYQRSFGARPPRLASLAYDVMAIAAVMGHKTPHDFSVPVLTHPMGFAGVDGLFRLLPDGSNDRRYAIDEIQSLGGPPREVVQPPVSFGSGV